MYHTIQMVADATAAFASGRNSPTPTAIHRRFRIFLPSARHRRPVALSSNRASHLP
jgi:hypothetical protein